MTHFLGKFSAIFRLRRVGSILHFCYVFLAKWFSAKGVWMAQLFYGLSLLNLRVPDFFAALNIYEVLLSVSFIMSDEGNTMGKSWLRGKFLEKRFLWPQSVWFFVKKYWSHTKRWLICLKRYNNNTFQAFDDWIVAFGTPFESCWRHPHLQPSHSIGGKNTFDVKSIER